MTLLSSDGIPQRVTAEGKPIVKHSPADFQNFLLNGIRHQTQHILHSVSLPDTARSGPRWKPAASHSIIFTQELCTSFWQLRLTFRRVLSFDSDEDGQFSICTVNSFQEYEDAEVNLLTWPLEVKALQFWWWSWELLHWRAIFKKLHSVWSERLSNCKQLYL